MDLNHDGIFTIIDFWYLITFGGNWVIGNILNNPELKQFLHLDKSYIGGFISFVTSIVIYLTVLVYWAKGYEWLTNRNLGK